MVRFYQNLLGKRDGLTKPLPKAEALAEAKRWLRGLSREEVERLVKALPEGTRVGKAKDPRGAAHRCRINARACK
jgi:hypothetical protein